jgi:DNA invertase Pin-like site-specific DNA recombinase
MCSVKPYGTPPTFKRHEYVSDKWPKAMRKPRNQLNSEIIKLHRAGNKGPAIAKELGISLSLVKKRKTELGLSKTRPKNPLQEILRNSPRVGH